MFRILVPAALVLSACASLKPVDESLTEYRGGRVWTGSAFEDRSVFVKDGKLVRQGFATPGVVEDITGRFVVPPYADVHSHITGPNDGTSDTFLRNGVFYVINPNVIVTDDAAQRTYYARPETYDVILSYGGITAPGGHPEKLYVEILSQNVYTNRAKDSFEGDAFHFVETEADIAPVVDLLETQGADLVKTYLLTSEEFEKRRDDPAYYGAKGLDPALYPVIVDAVHERGLRVAVHVETANDFRVAAEAGADIFAHLPGYGSLSEDQEAVRIDERAAQTAAASGAHAAATYGLTALRVQNGRIDAEDAEQNYAVQRANIDLLQDVGMPLVLGTDAFGAGIFVEAEHLVDIGALTPVEALKAANLGAKVAFPNRKIGRIAPGYEADFLILEDDPSTDVRALRSISAMVKAGAPLDPSP